MEDHQTREGKIISSMMELCFHFSFLLVGHNPYRPTDKSKSKESEGSVLNVSHNVSMIHSIIESSINNSFEIF